jgi:hypothetical protein
MSIPQFAVLGLFLAAYLAIVGLIAFSLVRRLSPPPGDAGTE